MMSQQHPILIINSTGKVGRRIAQQLDAKGIPYRGTSRSTPIRFHWNDEGTWHAALAGTATAFVSFVPDLALDGSDQVMRRLVLAARDAGVDKLVLLSGRGETGAIAAEDVVRASGLNWTIVRASWFNQNFSEGHLLDAVNGGVIAMPAGQRREAFVDVDDLAEVATAALLEDRHNGQIYEVTGPQLLSFADAARELSSASGRPVEYLPISPDEFHAALVPEVGSEMADLLRLICLQTLDGRNEWVGDGVRRALGRDPRSFTKFATDAFAAGAWQ